LLGKTIQKIQLKAGNNSVDVSNLTAGVYFIQTAAGASVKFVKE